MHAVRSDSLKHQHSDSDHKCTNICKYLKLCVCVVGALLKAVCVCSELVRVSSPVSLKEQLLQRWGGGLEIHSWSSLPHGSGLGTFE